MREACEKAGIKLANAHQRRLLPHHQEALKLLKEGTIGQVKRAWASVTPYYKDPMIWSTHVTDMLRFYLGDAEWVMGQIGEMAPELQRAGNYRYAFPYAAYVRFRNGACCVLEQESGPCQIHMSGETGQMLVHMDQVAKDGPPLRLLLYEAGRKVPGASRDGAWQIPSLEGARPPHLIAGYGSKGWDGFCSAVSDLVESIEQDRQPFDTGRDGAAALELLLAVYESARTRRRVYLPMEMKKYPLVEWGA